MTVHTIMLPDYEAGSEPRSIIWDDEKGTVEGEHSEIEWIRGQFARPTPFDLGDDEGFLILEDPAHDPADFIHILNRAYLRTFVPEVRATLPPILRDVKPRALKPFPNAVFDKEGRNLGPGYYDENGNPVVTGVW